MNITGHQAGTWPGVDERRERFRTLLDDYPGYEIRGWPDGYNGWTYTAVARHHGMDPPAARASSIGQLREELNGPVLVPLDRTVPNQARICDYWLGGKDNFAADRQVAEHVLEVRPEVAQLARWNRTFTSRAVEWVCRVAGIGQVLDLGAGFPTEARDADGAITREWLPTHLAAQSGYRDACCVYVDYDPVVIRHHWANTERPGLADAVGGDLRLPDMIWQLGGVRNLLDLDRPLVLVATAVLHYSPPDQARDIMARYIQLLPPGSYVVLSVGCGGGPAGDEITAAYSDGGDPPRLHNYTRVQAGDLFGGLPLVKPGLVPVDRWRPGWDEPRLATGGTAILLAGAGCKPGP